MDISEKVIVSLLDCFRGMGMGVTPETLELSLQLLAWAKLSKTADIPEELCLTEKTQLPTLDLQSVFKQLSELESLGENRLAFQDLLVMREDLDTKALVAALDIVYKFSQRGHLDYFEVPESGYSALSRSSAILIIPSEVSQFMLSLAGSLEKKRVYCPYDTSCFLARRAHQAKADVYVESPLNSPLPWITNILSNTDVHCEIGDPVRQPSYTKKDGTLEQFDVTVSFPPMGIRYDRAVIDQDWFARFPDRTSSGSVLQLRHILAQTKSKAIVAVPNNILFSRGAEHALRQELLERGMIEAIIAMPPAILSFTSISFSIIILNPSGTRETIRFVNGGSERFYERDRKSRSRLLHWQELLKVFYQSSDEALVLDVPVKEVLKNDAYLEVSRYLLPPQQKIANQLLQESEVTELANLVRFIRPSVKKQSEGDLSVYEVSIADFPYCGYLTTPQRTITLANQDFTAKEAETFLQPGDIVTAIKGSVGKLAIAPDRVPPAGEGGWVVNQSCIILRSKGKIDPKVLFMYLRSDLGQVLLEGIASGATIPLTQLRSLQQLKIIVPSAQEAQLITEAFDAQVELQQKIQELNQELYQLSKVHWSIEIESSI